MERALQAGATLIGINNRDLRTFTVDLGVSERLAHMAPDEVVLVGESGIFTSDDARRMRAAGMDAVLVGESLIVAPDRAAAIGRDHARRAARCASMNLFPDRPLVKICGMRSRGALPRRPMTRAPISSDSCSPRRDDRFRRSKLERLSMGRMAQRLPVGLFVDDSVEEINSTARMAGIQLLQIHWRRKRSRFAAVRAALLPGAPDRAWRDL